MIVFNIKGYIKDVIKELQFVEMPSIYYVVMILFGICIAMGLLSLLLLCIDMIMKFLVGVVINL